MVLATIIEVIEDYGWYVFIVVALFAYIFRRVKPYLEEFKQRKDEEAYAAKYHKNPDLLAARLAGQQNVVDRLQEKYNQAAVSYEKQMQEKMEKRKQELLSKYAAPSGSGQRLGGGLETDTNKSKSFKPEYNPLMGSSSRGYRPQKKKCGGGGCG